MGGILNNPKDVTPYLVNWEAAKPTAGIATRHPYRAACETRETVTCQTGILDGNDGGGFLCLHQTRTNTSSPVVSPIDLCKLKKKALSGVPFGISDIYIPIAIIAITSIAMIQ
jgi:hypothetical protein